MSTAQSTLPEQAKQNLLSSQVLSQLQSVSQSTLGRRSVISVHGSGGKAMTMSGTCRLDCSGSPCSQQISNNTARPFIHSQQQQQIDTFTWTGKWKGRNQSKSECQSLSKFTRQKTSLSVIARWLLPLPLAHSFVMSPKR